MQTAMTSTLCVAPATERVSADITTEDVLQIAREAGLTVDRKQAARFLRDDAHAHRVWKLMMEAGRQYIAESLEAEWVNESFPLSASKNRSSEEYDA